jgi:hypothetical protein
MSDFLDSHSAEREKRHGAITLLHRLPTTYLLPNHLQHSYIFTAVLRLGQTQQEQELDECTSQEIAEARAGRSTNFSVRRQRFIVWISHTPGG